MPENEKESKIMSMLERKGIIRRADGDSSGSSSGDATGLPDPEIKPIFDHAEEVQTVKTAPRQPVPGMPTPVLPQDKADDIPQESSRTVDSSDFKAPPVIPSRPAPEPVVERPAPPSYSEVPAPAPYAEPQRPAPSYASNAYRSNGAPSESTSMETSSSGSAPQPENYTNRYLNVNELYDALALRAKKTDTIYLIEEYLQTIPGSLPDSQRREMVSRLLAASGFDFDLLMGDGVLRVKMLKEYAERFARHTDDYIAARQAELDELDQQMMRTRKLIENRKELHKKQFYTIEAEAQRLKEILTFISG